MTALFMEDGGAFAVSGVDNILQSLEEQLQAA